MRVRSCVVPATARKLGEACPRRRRLAGSGGELFHGVLLLLPPPETALRAAFDAFAGRLGLVPMIAAEVEDMAMLRLLAREDAGLAVIPPIVVQDELAAGSLVEAAQLDDVTETFLAVTAARRFPNPLLSQVLTQSRFR